MRWSCIEERSAEVQALMRRRVLAASIPLLLCACAGPDPAGREAFGFDLVAAGGPTTLACTPGPDPAETRRRAEAAAGHVDRSMRALGATLDRTVRAALAEGRDVARAVTGTSRAGGEAMARELDARYGCLVTSG